MNIYDFKQSLMDYPNKQHYIKIKEHEKTEVQKFLSKYGFKWNSGKKIINLENKNVKYLLAHYSKINQRFYLLYSSKNILKNIYDLNNKLIIQFEDMKNKTFLNNTIDKLFKDII